MIGYLASILIIAVLSVYGYKYYQNYKQSEPILENYKDPLWMQPRKMYRDYYTRANGSIYGTPERGWNMFSGLNSNTRV